MLTEMTWKMIILGVMTYAWLFYLSWETTYYHRRKNHRKKWYERELKRKNAPD